MQTGTKSDKRPRGRPRAYDPDAALASARDAFWSAGYSATSLDDLGAATGMNRPSLYAAFGDKRTLYLKVLERYSREGRVGIEAALAGTRPLREELRQVYKLLLAMYTSGDGQARGCFLVGTALAEAVSDAGVREAFAASLRELDLVFERRFRRAREQGELDGDAQPAALGRFAAGIAHSLAIRARAGEAPKALERDAAAATDLLCGSGKSAKVPGRR